MSEMSEEACSSESSGGYFIFDCFDFWWPLSLWAREESFPKQRSENRYFVRSDGKLEEDVGPEMHSHTTAEPSVLYFLLFFSFSSFKYSNPTFDLRRSLQVQHDLSLTVLGGAAARETPCFPLLGNRLCNLTS